MMRILLSLILVIHGLIHLMGVTGAGHGMTQLSRPISRTEGLLWLMVAIIILTSAFLFFINRSYWWIPALVGALLSQTLIITLWKDAKFGTIANVVILVAVVFAVGNFLFQRSYEKDVRSSLRLAAPSGLVTDAHLAQLPKPVQRYLRYVGVVNKPIVNNYRIKFEGHMRDKGKDWFPFTSEQYNTIGSPTRLFFMKAKMYGVTVPGYHAFKNGNADMQIKLFGIIPVVNESGGILDKAETVTVFNDMCLLAPATLIDPSIRWKAIDDTSAEAAFTVKGTTIHATLIINEEGQLVNFISDDRYAISDGKQYRFSTPVRDYRSYSGYRLMSYGEAVWHLPDGEFTYGKFNLKEITYNVEK